MNSILILGASGLLGQALVDNFKSKELQIGLASRKPIDYKEQNIKSYSVDILDYKSVENIIKEYETIINCTGQVTNPVNLSLLLNTEGINNIVKAVKKHNKTLIHISSVSVYGSAEYVNEKSSLNPQTPYASMKCFAEFLIESNLDNYTILRVSNLFGKNQEKGIVNYLANSYQNRQNSLYFNNNGDLKRYYLNIEDLASIIFKLLEKKPIGIYNIIGADLLSIKELVAMFEEILEYKFKVKYSNELSQENIDEVDTSKIENLIKIEYKINLQKYIKELKL